MKRKDAVRRWSTRQRKYVVGYIASGNLLFHHERWDKRKRVSFPMTRREAKAFLAKMPSPDCAIFELTVIEIGGGAR